ncbi:Ubiquitin carboxyl-terminal hydrolase 10 [Pelomyxa schiedti]|nr:Ubiquitin carboxyl-terminal hydrolase 10 [Pelomyxa schiedti]
MSVSPPPTPAPHPATAQHPAAAPATTPPPGAGAPRPTPGEQWARFSGAMSSQPPMRPGDKFFVVSSRWFTAFKSYTSPSPSPSPPAPTMAAPPSPSSPSVPSSSSASSSSSSSTSAAMRTEDSGGGTGSNGIASGSSSSSDTQSTGVDVTMKDSEVPAPEKTEAGGDSGGVDSSKMMAVDGGSGGCVGSVEKKAEDRPPMVSGANDPKMACIKTVEAPGEIDNSDIVADDKNPTYQQEFGSKLKPSLRENYDYLLLPASAWALLYEWYRGGPVVQRFVIEEGVAKQTLVETYPLYIHTLQYDSKGHIDATSEMAFMASKKMTVVDFKRKACLKMRLPQNQARVWIFRAADKINLAKNESDTLERLCLLEEYKIIIELKLPSGEWVRSSGYTAMIKNFFSYVFLGFEGDDYEDPYLLQHSSNHSTSSYSDDAPQPGKFTPGLCGLHNLGNTCFMNSALQCLSNTPPLREYFVTNAYKTEINTANPLGMQGQIAEQFGILLKHMWSGSYSAVAPRNLKWVISKYAPQFSGYSQHDSHELLSFLLDGLHEDLNKITKKPYITMPEGGSNNVPDEKVATESWDLHLKRNLSIIVDLFQGQLRSTLNCPDCKKISITFDPFMYLSLPLPLTSNRVITAVVMRNEARDLPLKIAVKVPKNAPISQFRSEISRIAGLKLNDFLISNVFGNRIYTFWDDQRPVTGILDNDITIAYELPPTVTAESVRVHIVQRKTKTEPDTSSYYSRCPYSLFGLPFILFCTSKTTGRELYEKVYSHLRILLQSTRKVKPPPTTTTTPDEGKESATTSAEVNSGEASKTEYPFVLHTVTSSGIYCGHCDVKSDCWGCALQPTDEPAPPKTFTPNFGSSAVYFAVTWKQTAIDSTPIIENSMMVIPHPSCKETQAEATSSLSLDYCLQLFTRNEKLNQQNMWYCPHCKEHKQAFKKLDVWRLPKVLVVHLKRFVYEGAWREKICTNVDFPQEWDLTPHARHSDQAVYSLYAVSSHSGGLGGGHYTAYCRHSETSRWYLFNDSSTSPVAAHDVRGPSAYVLFYVLTNKQSPKSTTPPATTPTTTPETGSNTTTASSSSAPQSQPQTQTQQPLPEQTAGTETSATKESSPPTSTPAQTEPGNSSATTTTKPESATTTPPQTEPQPQMEQHIPPEHEMEQQQPETPPATSPNTGSPTTGTNTEAPTQTEPQAPQNNNPMEDVS